MKARNFKKLQKQGWLLTQSANEQEMLKLAESLGVPKASRSGGSLIDELRPIPKDQAHPASLSARYGVEAFPLHTDTAHWRSPARYILLRAARISHYCRPTLLLDTYSLRLSALDRSLLKRAVFTVRNGNNSFLTTVLPEDEQFLRFDRDCMVPRTSSAVSALNLILSTIEKSSKVEVCWSVNDTLILDNWRFLHGRSGTNDNHSDQRLLHRVLVVESTN